MSELIRRYLRDQGVAADALCFLVSAFLLFSPTIVHFFEGYYGRPWGKWILLGVGVLIGWVLALLLSVRLLLSRSPRTFTWRLLGVCVCWMLCFLSVSVLSPSSLHAFERGMRLRAAKVVGIANLQQWGAEKLASVKGDEDQLDVQNEKFAAPEILQLVHGDRSRFGLHRLYGDASYIEMEMGNWAERMGLMVGSKDFEPVPDDNRKYYKLDQGVFAYYGW